MTWQYLCFVNRVWITPQADAIISKLRTTDGQQGNAEPTILIAADTVCLVIVFIEDDIHLEKLDA